MRWLWAALGGGALLAAIYLARRHGDRSRTPTGAGVFVQSLHKISDEEIRRWITRDGVRHLIVQAVWQWVDKPMQTYSTSRRWPGYSAPWGGGPELDARLELARSLGAEVWPFGWAAPGQGDAFARVINDYRRMWDSPGVVIDAENEQGIKWTHDKVVAWCEEAMPVLRDVAGSVGVSTLAIPWFHPSFPFASWAPYVDFALPQTYYWPPEPHDLTRDYPARSRAAFEALGFRRVTGAAFSVGRSNGDFEGNVRAVLQAGFPAVTVWRGRDLSDQQAAILGQLVRQAESGGVA